jgi:hypothetical protein
MTDYAVQVTDGYVVPEGPLDAEQYVNFVMNRAAESYMAQYKTATVNEGIQAACDAYNAALPVLPTEEPAP